MTVYIVKAEGAGDLVKIGYAVDVKRRISHLQVSCPFKLVLLRSVRGGPRVEKEFHRQFEARRVRGEWFTFHDSMLSFSPKGEEPVRQRRKVSQTTNLTFKRPWKEDEKLDFRRLWDGGYSVDHIAGKLGRTSGGIKRARVMFNFPPRISPFFCVATKHRVFSFRLPISPGLKKLLERYERLTEWVEEGRDNYELSRAFHVPIQDVVRAVEGLELVRSDEYRTEVERPVGRRCAACGEMFVTTKYLRRCDTCLGAHAKIHDFECTTGAFV